MRVSLQIQDHRLTVSHRPWLTTLLLVLSDIAALLLAGYLAIAIKLATDPAFEPANFFHPLATLTLFLFVYAVSGLYPATGLAPAEELRRIVLATTVVYLVLGASTFLVKEAERYSRAAFLMAWFFSVVLVPLFRAVVRELFARKSWWGFPVLILGGGKTGSLVAQALKREPGLGLKPLAILDDAPQAPQVDGVPVIQGIENAPRLAKELRVRHAILAMPGVRGPQLLAIVEKYGQVFPHLILVPDLFGLSSMWVSTRYLGRILGLELNQRLLKPSLRFLKRSLDLALATSFGVLILPLGVAIALLIKLDSPGPVFYIQERIGKDGKTIRIVKFRTMHTDADQRLTELLETDPALKEEYERYHKLRNDPRVTRVGRVLRKLSLDELPQLWNVVKGEMSLVGPRAYLPRELPKLKGAERIILKVPPGITGLWQVSGRNQLSFEERVELDVYYVRNWSIWLDVYLLARTFWVVLAGKGAY